MSGAISMVTLSLLTMLFFEKQRAGIESCLQQRWGDKVKVFKAF